MGFFDKLLTIFNESNTAGLSREEIAILKRISTGNTPVIITVHGDEPNKYKSFLLEVVESKSYCILAGLSPTSGNELIAGGRRFTARSFDRGVEVIFTGRAENAEEGPAGYHFQIPLPEYLEVRQKRDSFRQDIPRGKNVTVQCPLPQFSSVLLMAASKGKVASTEARVMDLSMTGCRLQFIGDVREVIEHNPLVHGCEMRLEDDATVSVDLELCHLFDNASDGCTEVGAKFYRIQPDVERQLAEYLGKIQRELRRKDTGVDG